MRYATQSLGALHELHSLGVVMADLKPQNLLLDADLDELVVTDFGISKILSDTVGSFTGTTMVQGTPHYM
jgi:serine/threonine-protein kinase